MCGDLSVISNYSASTLKSGFRVQDIKVAIYEPGISIPKLCLQ